MTINANQNPDDIEPLSPEALVLLAQIKAAGVRELTPKEQALINATLVYQIIFGSIPFKTEGEPE